MVTAIVYTAPECPHCKDLKTFLDENEIDYEEKCVLTDHDTALELKNKSGQMAVPTVFIGDEIFIGFDRRTERRIKRHLGV